MPHLELAQGDPGEPLRVGPVLAAQESLHDERSVQMVLLDEKDVEEEQLADGVDDVEGLDRQVGGDQVVTVQTTADHAAQFGDEVLDPDATSGTMIPLGHQIAIHLVDDVPDRLLADLQVGGFGADVGGIHDRTQVDPGSFVEESPDLARDEGQDTLDDQDQGHPLVVADVLTLRHLVQRVGLDDLGHVQVVGAAHPADGVRVVDVAVRELGRTPAVDRRSDELLRADQEGEQDGQHDRVLPAQPVHVIIVHVELEFPDAEDRLEQPIHDRCLDGSCLQNCRRRIDAVEVEGLTDSIVQNILKIFNVLTII